MTEQGATRDGALETALQAQKQRVLAELDEEKTLDPTPIIQHENLTCEEYLTLSTNSTTSIYPSSKQTNWSNLTTKRTK